MASSRGKRLAIELVLAIIIAVLAYLLYRTITEPAEILARQEALLEESRARMDFIRDAMIRYERVNDRFPTTLDSLLMFAEQDTSLLAEGRQTFGEDFVLDSIAHSPYSGDSFQLTVDDTSRVSVYLLESPDRPSDYIGSLEQDPTLLNAASWE